MKVNVRKTRTGVRVSISARTAAEKDALTDAVLSGRLIRELNAIAEGKPQTGDEAEAAGRAAYQEATEPESDMERDRR